jgi:hypothetical protein
VTYTYRVPRTVVYRVPIDPCTGAPLATVVAPPAVVPSIPSAEAPTLPPENGTYETPRKSQKAADAGQPAEKPESKNGKNGSKKPEIAPETNVPEPVDESNSNSGKIGPSSELKKPSRIYSKRDRETLDSRSRPLAALAERN